MNLHPVLVPVPQETDARTPERVRVQRAAARVALRHCARLCGAPEEGWEKNADDVPRPQCGFYWSVSHKRHWAAAVIADRPVGVDIERIEPKRPEMFDELACADEWSLLPARSWLDFFRLWTAKEATLKANGVGIGEFRQCRVTNVPDDKTMWLEYRARRWKVEHFHHDDHVAAVTVDADTVTWHVVTDIGAP
jgi:4'-phosphopantetheinyl transferase